MAKETFVYGKRDLKVGVVGRLTKCIAALDVEWHADARDGIEEARTRRGAVLVVSIPEVCARVKRDLR